MLFDFDRFQDIVRSIYHDGDGLYSVNEVLHVFWVYFRLYEANTGHAHPPIKAEQIKRIIQEMPYISREDIGGCMADIDAQDYDAIIGQHFQTKYRNCDYNINHFFSGRIRELRYCEMFH